MIFVYDPNRYFEYYKKDIIFRLIFLFVFIIILSLFIFITTKDYKIALIIFIILVVSLGIGTPIGYARGKGYFISNEIDCNEETIIFRSLMSFNKKINFDKINKIIKDDENNIYIVLNKINIIRILPYVENMAELEKYLSKIVTIEYNYKYSKYYFFQYIPEYLRILPFIALFSFSNMISNFQSYIFFAIYILISIYSSIKCCIDQIKLRNKFIAIIINVFSILLLFMMYNESK